MTPPKVGLALTPDAALPTQNENLLAAKKVEPAKVATRTIPEPHSWSYRLTTNYLLGQKGDINSVYGSNNIGQFNDLKGTRIDFSALRDLAGNKARLRLGIIGGLDIIFGGPNTGGSSLFAGTVGGRAELGFIWPKSYRVFGPDSIGLDLTIGGGRGNVNSDGGFVHHTVSGFASFIGCDLNLLNFKLGNLSLGLNFRFQAGVIRGSAENIGVRQLGGGLVVRWPRGQKLEKTCANDLTAIARQENRIKRLLAEKTQLADLIAKLRHYLEHHPKHPFNTANMTKARILGAVAEQLNQKNYDATKIAAIVKAGNREKNSGKIIQIIMSQTGMPLETARTIYTNAVQKIKANADFWATTVDPVAVRRPDVPQNAKGKACEPIQQYRDDLEAFVAQLARQVGELTSLHKAAVHLAGLSLGVEDTKEILFATVVNIDTPSFKTDYPKPDQMKALEAGKISVDRLATQVFSVSKFETGKLNKLAKWMNGEGELPGEERIRKILNSEFKKTGRTALDDSPQGKKAYREFIKKLEFAIFGHTDRVGSAKHNQGLSERRAEFIRKYLVAKRVKSSRLLAKGFGEEYPALRESGRRGAELLIARGKNRRVEFVPVKLTAPTTAPASQNPDQHDATKVKGTKGGSTPPTPPADPDSDVFE